MTLDETADYHQSKAMLATVMVTAGFTRQDGTLFTLVRTVLTERERITRALYDDNYAVGRLLEEHRRITGRASQPDITTHAEAQQWLSALRAVVMNADESDMFGEPYTFRSPVTERPPAVESSSSLPAGPVNDAESALMRSLPESGVALLVRTDFADDADWSLLCVQASAPSEDGFVANFEPISDVSFSGASGETVKAAVPLNTNRSAILLIADAITFGSVDHPILVVNLTDFEGEHLDPFRCIPGELWGVENNLNLPNMDWEDFAGSTDDNGVFRGF